MSFVPQDVNETAQRIPVLLKMAEDRPSSLILADLGAAYFTMGENDKARALLEKAWDKNKTIPSIALNLGLVYKDLGMHKESFHMVETAYWMEGDSNSYVALGYQEALLKQGFWDRAWDLEKTRATQELAAFDLRLPLKIKKWHGEKLNDDQLLLVISEGGFGDRLSYPRWLPTLSEMGINWKFYPYFQTYPFFERILPTELLVKDGDQITPDPTHWTTTFGLPQDLRATPTSIPEPLPILASDEMIAKYKVARSDDLPVLGICYRAGELYQGGRTVRSLSEGQAMRLVTSTAHRIHWVNLQWRTKMDYPVVNMPIDTWDEFAGLIHHLDGVVTVDTGTYHLAAGMGKKTAVILSANSCWKFGLHGSQDPWYPSATLYRSKVRPMDDAIDLLIADINAGKIF